MADVRKGLRDIPTLSGRVDRVSLPYRAFLKISCLEMEKVRRTRERVAAVKTVEKIDIRLQEIEKEKAALLLMMEQPSRGGCPPDDRQDAGWPEASDIKDRASGPRG